MSDNDSLHPVEGFTPEMAKSIFPAFAVNVPMPRDTAVPGSYSQQQPARPAQSSSTASDH